ncbi:hypothetical protein BAU15_07385 [Enterococcus sp. JM4C]|uniref:hypothetical protein n=1 Tax=Candidatus Enterococcus huntleyi TaxID=1857217 RepID=UPI00137AC08B|nr:hypothetical protein [Enterococcus sp. JM4C]KAF1297529.1 hypothetical protein BAU15_07385 [Enterococcus sp. JM4C]
MNERMISFLMVPLLFSYQTNNIMLFEESVSVERKEHFQLDEYTASSRENTLIVENEHKDNFKKKLLLEKKMADMEQETVLNDSNDEAQLGRVLASMSGTILFGTRF